MTDNGRQDQYGQKSKVPRDFIFRDLGLLCKTATLPGTAYATAQVTGHQLGIVQKYAHTRIYPDFTMTFIVDKKYRVVKFFELWQQFMSQGSFEDPSRKAYYHRMEYPVHYKCETLRIQKFDKDHNNDIEYTFINAFPRSISPVTVSYDSSRVLEVSVTFSYDRHFFGRMDSLSKAYKSRQLTEFDDQYKFVNSVSTPDQILSNQQGFEKGLDEATNSNIPGTTSKGLSGAGTFQEYYQNNSNIA